MTDIRRETRNSSGSAARLACASLLFGAAGLLSMLPLADPAAANGVGIGHGGGLDVGASVGDLHVGAGAQTGAATDASASRSESADESGTETKTRTADLDSATGLDADTVVDAGKLGASIGLEADSATGASVTRSETASPDAESGDSAGEDQAAIAIIDASVQGATDASVQRPAIVRATK